MNQEVILLMGSQASGKTSAAQEYLDKGYVHLNRDKIGGKIADLVPLMIKELSAGKSILLDNTYATAESRKPFIQEAQLRKIPVRCLHMDTRIEDAQFNAAKRIIERKGRLLSPEEMKADKDPNIFPVTVLFAYHKAFQVPDVSEGFNSVETLKFVRKNNPEHTAKALILDYDGTLRKTKSGKDYSTETDDIEILPGRVEKLKEYKDKGYILLGVSNQSGVAKGSLSNGAAKACFEKTNKLLGHDIDFVYCPHGSFPIACYCRKPIPGHFVLLQEKYKLDANQCIFVGDMTSDKTFAKRSGIKYLDQSEFFR